MKTKLFFLTFILFSPFFSKSQSIISVSPASGNAGEKINVTITGQNTNFQQGSDVIRLTNGSTVTPIQSTFVNATTIQSVFAFNKDNDLGNYNLTVQKNGSYTLNLNSCFNLAADPTIASIDYVTPTSANQTDIITLTIKGLNTNFGSSGIPTIIILNQGAQHIDGTNIVAIDSVTIQAHFVFTYAHPTGIYDVVFYNALDGTVTDAGAFTLNAGPAVPAITSITPTAGAQGQVLSIAITGQNTNFQQGTDVIKLTNGGTVIYPQQSTFDNATLIHSTFAFALSNPVGPYNLSIQKYGSYTLTLNNCFYLNSSAITPSLVSVTPAFADQGTTATLTITGLNTHFGLSGTTTTPRLKYGSYQINASATNIIDSLTMQVQFYLSTSYPTGLYNLIVNNTIDGNLTLNNVFTINTGPTSPIITSVSPNIASPGQTLSVSITGQNTNFQQGTSNINLNQGNNYIYPNTVTYSSGTLINATFSISTGQQTGYYNVNVPYPDPVTLTHGFLVAQFCNAQYTVVPDTAHHIFIINNTTGYQPINYLWSWGDGTYDSVAYPSHTYNAAGTYTICLSITDSLGCTSTYCDSSYLQKNINTIISVDVVPPLATGINPDDSGHQIKIYPDPTISYITIESPSNAILTIFNLLGQPVKSLRTISAKTSVDVSLYPKGVYILEVTGIGTDNGMAVKNFVKE